MTTFSHLGWRTAVDFGVLAATLYLVLVWAKEARALRIVLGIASLHSAALFAHRGQLIITAVVLEAAAIILVLLLFILFQPELRRAVMRIEGKLHLRREPSSVSPRVHEVIGAAVFSLSSSHIGALIVFPGQDSIHELVESGIGVDAEITAEIIVAIFQKSSPIHDGAILVEGNRITRAKVVLPLTQRADVPKTFGTRHRAAMGLAERSDAAVVVVSEEDAAVRMVRGRELKTLASPTEFVQALGRGRQRINRRWISTVRRLVTSNIRLKVAATGLAAILWSFSFFAPAVERTFLVPVEVENLPAGMEVADISHETLQVQMHGHPWMIDSIDVSHLVASVDLSGARPGTQMIRVRPELLRLPPGVNVDRVLPSALGVRIELSRGAASSAARSGQQSTSTMDRIRNE
jgi:diadenylate cyclase